MSASVQVGTDLSAGAEEQMAVLGDVESLTDRPAVHEAVEILEKTIT